MSEEGREDLGRSLEIGSGAGRGDHTRLENWMWDPG